MKLLIVALNAKYTHTSLAAFCLYSAVRDICDVSISQYTINDSSDDITEDIYSKNPDCVAFSCYIWNIEHVLKIASVLKKANPGLKIVLGGHEAEHDAEKFLKKYHFIDAVLRGEGEISLKHYAEYLTQKRTITSCCLITYRENGKIVSLPSGNECVDLNEMPFVYDESIDNIKNRIIYYETSRGCPYGCTYCLSGEGHHVRFLHIERVKK